MSVIMDGDLDLVSECVRNLCSLHMYMESGSCFGVLGFCSLLITSLMDLLCNHLGLLDLV